MIKKIIFRQYDIRGSVPDQLSAETSKTIANAFARIIKKRLLIPTPTILIGKDIRLSSDAIHKSVIHGLLDAGCHIIDIGVCPTPLISFTTHTIPNIEASIMITGSHNPPKDNGLKFTIGNKPFHSKDIQDLFVTIQKDYLLSPQKGTLIHNKMVEKYLHWNAYHFSKMLTNLKQTHHQIKIVIDAANGTASTLAPKLLDLFNIEYIPLFCKEDGRFPNHHPDPTRKENMEALSSAVLQNHADFGVAFDGDADRIGVVDENGRIVHGDQLLYIFAKSLLKEHTKPKIVADVKTSQHIYDTLNSLGIETIMCKSGNPIIKDMLKATGAKLSGEMSAHISFADRFFGYDDALYAMLRLIELYLENLQTNTINTFSNLLKGLPTSFSTQEIYIDCPDHIKFDILSEFSQKFPKETNLTILETITIDGMRIHLDDGWALIRTSNTQPAITMRFEASTEEKTNYYEQVFTKKVNALISKSTHIQN